MEDGNITYKFLKSSTSILNEEIKMLDYGSYNGLPYALKQKHKINSYVADLDPKGLNIAKFLAQIINLSVNKIIEKIDLITIVRFLEHLKKSIDRYEFKNALSGNE